MKKYLSFLFVMVVFLGGTYFLLVNAPSTPAKKIEIKPTPTLLSSDKLWSLIQDWRESNGFQPYIKDQRLCEIAGKRIKAGNDKHKGFYNEYSDSPFVLSENSIWNNDSESHALTGWINSPAHLENLQKPYKYSCLVTERMNALQIFSNF